MSKDADIRSGRASADPSDRPADNPNTGYSYKVYVRTDKAQFLVDRELRPIQSGMTVQADIVTDKRRVIDFFLSPVVKYLDESLKVR